MSINIRSNDDLMVHLVESEEKPKYVFFWGHKIRDIHQPTKGVCSQWFPSDMEINGVRYPTAEHWMMVNKAMLFDDTESVEKIMATTDPHVAKKLGRQVKGFNDAEWNKVKYDVVVEGNVAKFTQNPKLKEFLLATGDTILVEASPYDKVWGIGMKEDEPNVDNPHFWKGQNLLGYALMEVRDRIRDSETEA